MGAKRRALSSALKVYKVVYAHNKAEEYKKCKKFYYPLRLFNERSPHAPLLQSRLFTFIPNNLCFFLKMVLFSTNAGCEITCSGSQDGTICKNLLPLKMNLLFFFFFFNPFQACRGQCNKHYGNTLLHHKVHKVNVLTKRQSVTPVQIFTLLVFVHRPNLKSEIRGSF